MKTELKKNWTNSFFDCEVYCCGEIWQSPSLVFDRLPKTIPQSFQSWFLVQRAMRSYLPCLISNLFMAMLLQKAVYPCQGVYLYQDWKEYWSRNKPSSWAYTSSSEIEHKTKRRKQYGRTNEGYNHHWGIGWRALSEARKFVNIMLLDTVLLGAVPLFVSTIRFMTGDGLNFSSLVCKIFS